MSSLWPSSLPLIGRELLTHLRKKKNKNNPDPRLVDAVGINFVTFENKDTARTEMIQSVKNSKFWRDKGYDKLSGKEQEQIAKGMWEQKELIFDNRCARCRKVMKHESNALGGLFGGVVCGAHKVCIDCWFGTDYNYGARQYEPQSSIQIPIVHGPRKHASPVCYGCHYRVPFSSYKINQCLSHYYPKLQPTNAVLSKNVIVLNSA